jgi:hypothetical protein
LEDADEDILGQVFSLVQIMEHAKDHVDDGVFVFLDQFLKSLEVSVFNAEHKRGIGVHGRGHYGLKLPEHRPSDKVAAQGARAKAERDVPQAGWEECP